MYLKRIELYGFKSFADRTELEFVPGVTAVVGPNGSGKSNVSDSIRWVLGEQSAKSLRGAKMEDIIFAGSDTRKAVNYAEVSLTLDNSDRALDLDYSEVSVTRRVYRSGESEFFINKQSCRLKDIAELFMDTGLGKEAYSIIGQGRIEEILSTKSEDRRGIFEEAAGVVKYKNRKRDAERKLDDTQGNLVRIQDIIYELEDQIEPLREQSEKAQKYKLLKEDLTAKEIATYVYLIESLHAKWEESSRLLEELKRNEQRLSVEVNQEDAQLEKKKWAVNQIEQKLEGLQQELLAITEEVEKLEGQREVLKERKRNYSSNKQEVVEKIESLRDKKEVFQSEADQESEKLQALKVLVDDSKNRLKAEEKMLESLGLHVDERLEKLKGDYIEILNEQASMKNELRHVEQSIIQYKHRIKKLHEEHGRYVEERQNLLNEIEVQEEEVRKLTAQIQTLRERYQELAHEKKERTLELEKESGKHRDYVNQLDKINARKQLLQEMKDDFTGFFQGVKEVLKARDSQLQGIDGAIAELIKVPKQVEIAIETALGASLQHIVVRDEESARQAISFLKQRNLGRATFLPRNVMKGRQVAAADLAILQSFSGFVGMANELIQFEEPYSQVMGNLLGHVVVTRELKEANEMAKRLQYRYRIVTLEGDVVNPGGSMTGGSVKQNQSNLLGREREIERLTQETEKATVAIQELQHKLQQQRNDLQAVEEALERVSAQGEEYKVLEQHKKDALSQLLFNKSRLDEKLEVYDQEHSTYQQELTQAEQKQISYTQKLKEYQLQAVTIENEIKELEVHKKENQASKEEKNQNITQLKVELAKHLQEFEGVQRTVERLHQNIVEISAELQEAELNLSRLEGDLGEQDSQVDELDQLITVKKERKDWIASSIEEQRQTRKAEQHEVERIEINLKQLRRELRTLEEKAHQEEVKVNRLDVELENYLTLLREEYELSYELAKERYPLKQEYALVKKDVDELKRQIQLLGNVNLGAIEEFERVQERFEFLKRQEEDLNLAKESLHQVINEMDEEMSKRFKETFDQVREQFHDVFEQLFGGGRADLLLSNPDDLLHTGVDIVAQPPGKKLQHLALLSGGERALTAMALLFAILRVKPVPFCVLDEVEAALDEANVSRYAQYLREFSKQTQFIVITHRKGTMEGADVLYGVTMQESGVSKLVSVQLEEKENMIPA